jgi:hypothetical protein
MAQFAKASIQSNHGETEMAVATLKDLLDKGGFPKSTVTLEIGRVYEAADKKDEARTYYDKVVTDYGDSPLREDAEAALRRLGFPIPAPAAPQAPAATVDPAPAEK